MPEVNVEQPMRKIWLWQSGLHKHWFLSAYGCVLIITGLALILPGFHLLILGGSVYYVVAGIAVAAAGVVLLAGYWSGALIYLVAVLGTVSWTIYEVGFDGWALVPRLIAPIALGIPLLLAALVILRPRAILIMIGGSGFAVIVVAATLETLREKVEGPANAGFVSRSSASIDWPYYGNRQGGGRFSTLEQITPANIHKLRLAWRTHLDQVSNGLKVPRFEVTPLKIGDYLYACTPLNDIFAINPATGKLRWRFKARVNGEDIASGICRGLAYYRISNSKGDCSARIYTGTIDGRLLAVDANNGKACKNFGVDGQVDLLAQMGQKTRGYYSITSPPQLVRGRLVVGGFVADGQRVGEPSGAIRAYDAITGHLAWAWDMGRPDRNGAPPKGETYTLGTPNSWAPMSADERLGLVYVPTGNATPDYYGARRTPQMEKYSSSLVALDAVTGQVRWSFQFVHHDLWDYDVPAQPVLADLPIHGATVPAVVQVTKNGQVFVLDRRTGRPIFPVKERPVPGGGVNGERISPMQPYSSLPSFGGSHLTEAGMWGVTPFDQLWCRIRFREARYDGPFTPPGLKPTIAQPGFSGGIEWGGASYDSVRNTIVFASNHVVAYDRLVPRNIMESEKIFAATDLGTVDWLKMPQEGVPFGAYVSPFLSPLGIPCTLPPFGRLNAVDLKTGQLIWTRPLGTARATGILGIPSHLPITVGTPSFGGAMTTASGITFIAATLDHSMRAFETRTGRLLWVTQLPGNGLATPMTYSTPDGRQFVVIAVGDEGDKSNESPSPSEGAVTSGAGGSILAFALSTR